MDDHLAVRHGIGQARFKCEHCGQLFVNSTELNSHIEAIHLKNKEYHCDQCNYFGYAQKNLNKHKRVKHPNKKA